MSSRKPGYLIGVILLALVLSAPQIAIVLECGTEAYQSGSWPTWRLPPIPGTSRAVVYGNNILTDSTFWRDQFIYVTYRQPVNFASLVCTIDAISPESGETTTLDITFTGRNGFQPMSFGERLWLIGGTESYEVVEGAVQPANLAAPRGWFPAEQQLLLNGEAAYVSGTPQSGFRVSTFTAGRWGNDRDVVLPNRYRDLMFRFQRGVYLTCLNQGDRVHVFLHTGGRLFYREGLELQPADTSSNPFNGQRASASKGADEPVSALRPVNFDGASAGWSLVREDTSRQHPLTPFTHQNLFGMLVGGRPAAMIVEDNQDGTPVGKFYRFDGTNWSEFATRTFPFGSNNFRAVSCRDGEKAYIVATTTTGAGQVYAVEATGIRATKGASQLTTQTIQQLMIFGMIPVGMLVLGCIMGLGAWFLMWWYTKSDFGFGVQNVKLASLGWRGLARLIDLGLTVLSTLGLGWAMLRGFDWLTLFEALNLRRVDHPTKDVAARVASILALWLVVVVLVLLIVQARWGVTPGKWCCGLRTLRTTLKPCGFARSLVREVVLSVDACNFLCWAPGIVCLAFTDYRQRLGDLVADTLVVEARLLSHDKPE